MTKAGAGAGAGGTDCCVTGPPPALKLLRIGRRDLSLNFLSAAIE